MSAAQVKKAKALAQHHAALEQSLPSASPADQEQILATLDKIEAQMEREIKRAERIGNVDQIIDALGLDGAGGLGFDVQAPPGVGRLVRMPFYPSGTVPANYITSGGAATASAVVPTFTYRNAGGAAITDIWIVGGAEMKLQTPQISWAEMRIVGFEVDMQGNNRALSTAGVTVTNSVFAPKLICKDLKIGGGANLFTHENYADADIYDAQQPEYCGLRDYPVVKSPNQAEVTVAAVAVCDSDGAGECSITATVVLLCEILNDDVVGAHIPGPYARKDAMIRHGGSFIS